MCHESGENADALLVEARLILRICKVRDLERFAGQERRLGSLLSAHQPSTSTDFSPSRPLISQTACMTVFASSRDVECAIFQFLQAFFCVHKSVTVWHMQTC